MLRKQITSGSINLVDKDSKQPVYTRQMSKIGEQGYRAAQGSPGADELLDEDDVSQMGPDEPDEAELAVKPQAMQEIVKTVDTVIRRDSIRARK
mmetsp:Transcript_42868/g.56685  ORF Transcript_42868/g.56685 Transcript_42868/m.56685 type:complete len:94 (-) Transcript_42868:117-398(-)